NGAGAQRQGGKRGAAPPRHAPRQERSLQAAAEPAPDLIRGCPVLRLSASTKRTWHRDVPTAPARSAKTENVVRLRRARFRATRAGSPVLHYQLQYRRQPRPERGDDPRVQALAVAGDFREVADRAVAGGEFGMVMGHGAAAGQHFVAG